MLKKSKMSSNIKNYDAPLLKMKVNYDEYWDFFPSSELASPYCFPTSIDEGCLISYIDISNDLCRLSYNGENLKSLSDYEYESAVTTENYYLNNIGSTGVDVGLFTFDKHRISNKEFYELYTQSSLEMPTDTSLRLNAVKGNVGRFSYPMQYDEENRAEKMNGGFYNGIFMTQCGKYQILPSAIEDCWHFEFVLKRKDFDKEGKLPTLNDLHPENRGIFFYIGTRAENKWWKYYGHYEDEVAQIELNEDKSACEQADKDSYTTSSYFKDDYMATMNGDGVVTYFKDDYFDTPYIYQDSDYILNNGVPLITKDTQFSFDTDNKFVFFDRTCTGINVCNYSSADTYTYYGSKHPYRENLFISMNRTCTGKTVCTLQDEDETEGATKNEYSLFADLYRNAFALQITNEGAVKYKYLIRDCESDYEKAYKIESEQTRDGLIPYDEWAVINVRINKASDDYMRIYIYVNGLLCFISKLLPIFNLHEFADMYEKQEGVPYTISLGGGTQGLAEVIYPNFNDCPEYVLPLEKHFGGSFIGYMRSFKMYNCHREYMLVKGNYIYEKMKF